MRVDADPAPFHKSMRALYEKHYPEALAMAFSEMAISGLSQARERVRKKYNLHTNWIPENFAAIPVTPEQRAAAEKSLRAHGDMLAAVYLKGAVDPRRSLGFMAEHEDGTTRRPKKKTIAAPASDYSEKRAKGSRGRPRKEWTPAEMLARFKAAGSVYENGTTITRSFPGRKGAVARGGLRRTVGNWFILKGRYGTPMIVRRSPKKGIRETTRLGKRIRRFGLEFGYALENKQRIEATFEFVKTVFETVAARQRAAVARADARIPRKV